MIIDLKIVIREFLAPLDLTGAQTFGIHKFINNMIINKE